MFFAPLPVELSHLKSLAESSEDVAPVSPPEMASLGHRLRSTYRDARERDYRAVSASVLRKLPYAYWVADAPELPAIEPRLVERYWSSHLPSAVSSGIRREKRWLQPLFFTYCEHFDHRDEVFRSFAKNALSVIQMGRGSFAQRLQQLHSQDALFSPDNAPARLAVAFLDESGTLDDVLRQRLLWPAFFGTRLGRAAFEAALALPPQKMRDWAVVVRLVDWVRRLGAPVQQSELRVPFANAVLAPWTGKRTPDAVKTLLMTFFVGAYGDPRQSRHKEYQWHGVADGAVSVIKTWLAGDTLRGFMRVLQRTADEIWRYREKFWMAYYDAGYIEEAWVALGTDARKQVNVLLKEQQGMGYSRLDGSAASNQSVLLLRIGHLLFTEWSHNGSLRAYVEDEPAATRLYMSYYDAGDLRALPSMDFHDGVNANPELRHMNSAGGSWQRKARDFIQRHTGLYISDREII